MYCFRVRSLLLIYDFSFNELDLEFIAAKRLKLTFSALGDLNGDGWGAENN